MKNNKIDFPEPPNQGSRKEQLEASAKAIVNITIIFIVLVIGTFIWNNFF